MPHFEIALQTFSFPKKLSPDKANFRLVLQLRYFTERGQPALTSTVLPSLDSYYECDWRKADDIRFVGATAREQKGNKKAPSDYGKIDPDRLDVFDRTAFLVSARSLHSIQLSVFDVDRKDVWDALVRELSSVVPGLFDVAEDAFPAPLHFSDDLRVALSRRASGPGDRLISTIGESIAAEDRELDLEFSVASGDYQGDYLFRFSIAASDL